MRILVLTDYFLPHASGGIERAAFEVSRRIAREGHDVTVLTFRRDGLQANEDMDGLHIIRVPAVDFSNLVGIQLSASAHVWPAIRKVIKERRIDLMHAHGIFFHASLAAAVTARTTGMPLITTAHVGSLASLGGAASRLSFLYEQSVGRFILSSSCAIIAVSQAVAEHVSGIGAVDNRVTIIPNGVEMERFAPLPKVGRKNRPPRMIFVGRLIANKGPQYVVAALPRVLDTLPHAECWFVGDGPMRSALEHSVREKNIESSVRFLGERDDVADLLRECDVFVRPSLSEGMPLAVLEAMAARLPVIVTPVGGTPEIVEDGVTGFLVNPGDLSSLEDRLCLLLGDKRLQSTMGARAFRAAAGYDWDAVSERTREVYANALDIRPAEIPDTRAA